MNSQQKTGTIDDLIRLKQAENLLREFGFTPNGDGTWSLPTEARRAEPSTPFIGKDIHEERKGIADAQA